MADINTAYIQTKVSELTGHVNNTHDAIGELRNLIMRLSVYDANMIPIVDSIALEMHAATRTLLQMKEACEREEARK